MNLSFSSSGFDNDSLGISVQDQLSDHPFFEVDICYDGCVYFNLDTLECESPCVDACSQISELVF